MRILMLMVTIPILASCEKLDRLLYGEIVPDAIEVSLDRYTNTTDGFCRLYPKLVAVRDAELKEVHIIQYGNVVWSGTGAAYWGRVGVAPGDTLYGESIRTYAGWNPVYLNTMYEQDGKRKASSKRLICG